MMSWLNYRHNKRSYNALTAKNKSFQGLPLIKASARQHFFFSQCDLAYSHTIRPNIALIPRPFNQKPKKSAPDPHHFGSSSRPTRSRGEPAVYSELHACHWGTDDHIHRGTGRQRKSKRPVCRMFKISHAPIFTSPAQCHRGDLWRNALFSYPTAPSKCTNSRVSEALESLGLWGLLIPLRIQRPEWRR